METSEEPSGEQLEERLLEEPVPLDGMPRDSAGLLYRRVDMFIDIALAYAMLNFIAVLAASRYFQKRKGLFDETPAGER